LTPGEFLRMAFDSPVVVGEVILGSALYWLAPTQALSERRRGRKRPGGKPLERFGCTKGAAEVETWAARAVALMDVPNWTYHNLIIEDMKAKAAGLPHPEGWRPLPWHYRLRKWCMALAGSIRREATR